jgi:hypothetical protein
LPSLITGPALETVTGALPRTSLHEGIRITIDTFKRALAIGMLSRLRQLPVMLKGAESG